MKKFSTIIKTFVLVAGLSFAACGSSDDGAPKIALPEFAIDGSTTKTEISGNAGISGEITFTAKTTWEISKNKNWISFGLSEVTGGEGTFKVTYALTYDNIDYDNDETGKIIFTQTDGQIKEIAVTRIAKARQIKFYTTTEPYTELSEIVFTKAESGLYHTAFRVSANFAWEVSSMPDWITPDKDSDGNVTAYSGSAGEYDPDNDKSRVMSLFANPEAFEVGTIMSSTMTFKADGATFTTDIPVKFDEVISSDYLSSDLSVTVSFTAEGYITAGLNNDPTTDTKKTFNVIAGEDGYQFYIFTVDPQYGYETMAQWNAWVFIDKPNYGTFATTVTNDAHSIEVNANTAAAREAYIYMLPASVATDTWSDKMIASDYMSIKPEYEQYYLTKVSQEGAGAGIALGDSWGTGTYGATLTKITGDNVEATYGTTAAYKLEVDAFSEDNSSNTLTLTGFDGENPPAITSDPASALADDGWIGTEPMNMGSWMIGCTWLKNETSADRTATLTLKDNDNKIFAVVVVTQKPASAQ